MNDPAACGGVVHYYNEDWIKLEPKVENVH